MSLGRPLARLQLEREEREQLEAMASSRSLPHGLVTRVRIVLLGADGLSNKDIAARLRLNQVTVGHWRRRFVKQGLAGLRGAALRTAALIPDEKVATLIRRTLRTKPKDGRPLELPRAGGRNAFVEIDRSPDLARLRLAAAPSTSLSAFQRPLLRREGAGHCRVVSEPPG